MRLCKRKAEIVRKYKNSFENSEKNRKLLCFCEKYDILIKNMEDLEREVRCLVGRYHHECPIIRQD